MNPVRISELLRPFFDRPAATTGNAAGADCPSEPARAGEPPAALSDTQLQSISTYIDILLRWNARINLTAIRDPEDIVTRHFGESLFAARLLFPAAHPAATLAFDVDLKPSEGSIIASNTTTLADIGSGAGFPGIPIKLWAPHIALTLVESNHKKSAFLREVTRALTLTNVNIQDSRAEALAETFSVVTLRAVERFDVILTAAAARVAPKGRLALLIGSSQLDPARKALPDFLWSEAAPLPLSTSRIVLVGTKPH